MRCRGIQERRITLIKQLVKIGAQGTQAWLMITLCELWQCSCNSVMGMRWGHTIIANVMCWQHNLVPES